MMVLHRAEGRLEHRHVADLPEYLSVNDLLVLNDTRVFPARIRGQWVDTGGAKTCGGASPARDDRFEPDSAQSSPMGT